VGVSFPTRAYSLLTVEKAVDDGEQRIIEGTASDITTDRMGDVVEPKGAVFKLPLPLLWQHDKSSPIGHVIEAKVSKTGIKIKAQIAKGVLPYIEESWALIKAGLVRGLSIGFRPLEDGIEQIPGSFGLRFTSWEWLELSAVTIPAHQDATISTIKALDALPADAGGTALPVEPAAPVAAPRVVKTTPTRHPMKTYQEQIRDIEATIAAKSEERQAIHAKAVEAGRAKEADERETFDALGEELKALQKELADTKELEAENVKKAAPVAGTKSEDGSKSRGGTPVVQIKSNLPPGVGFARFAKVKMVSYLDHRNSLEVAKEMYSDDDRLHAHIKAAVPAATTTQTTWASPLVDPTNLAGEFIEFLRPATIIGKFGTDGIPALRRIPFNVRIIEQTVGGTGYWVGQGAPKPLTAFGYAPVTNAITKVAAITVLTDELIRLSSPSADMLARDGLRDALVERIDRDFIDPAEAGTANVQPASITNGLTALTSAGTSADNARTDLANLLSTFIEANINPTSVVLIMPATLALALSVQVNSLGQPEFPGLSMSGGRLNGIPVIVSQYAANASGGGNLVIAVNASDIFLSDDGQVTIDASREASLQMLDNPTNNSATATPTTMVSMWQTNSVALRAERFINWSKRRDDAVVYMDDVNWGSIGSPA
jgi:HK97 family phage major capsid protein/HK97 family phage prohead protease